MATNVVMPKWGLSMQKGRVCAWLKQEGDAISEGEELVEIESDKINNVVEAPVSGILARIVVPAGEDAPITELIAIITAPGEAIPVLDGRGSAPTSAGLAPAQAPTTTGGVAPTERGKNVKAMPVARKMAEEQGLDLAAIVATGPGGTITKQDVERAVAARAVVAAPSPIRAMPAARKRAQELGIDLATVRATGPNGAITVKDVEQTASIRSASSAATTISTKPTQKVTFYSEGHKLDGLLYTPSGLSAGETRPAVVLCVGYTYLKTLVLPDIGKALSKAGYVSLVFDYRGFGESDGPRWRLIPQEQVSDVRAAVTFLADVPHVDANKLAVVGLSMGGSHAISAAAADRRIKAAVALESPGDGTRWLRSLRRHYEWLEFEQRIAADRSQRVRTGQSSRVDPLEIVAPDPESKSFLEAVYQEFPQMKCDLPLESAEAILEYSPQSVIHKIAPRPVMLIHGADDRLVPSEESEQMYLQTGGASELVVIPGMGHFNWVMPNHPIFQRVTGTMVEFLQTHIPT